jgi:phosphatidylglycerophosphate synthase
MLADLLTSVRAAGLAPLLVAALAAGNLGVSAVLLSLSWVSDAFDGRFARRSPAGGRLGRYDLHADTLVGVAAVAGLSVAGFVSPLMAGGLIVVLGAAFVVWNMPAAGMLLQAIGYGRLLWELWQASASGWWLPPLTVVLILAFDWRRFTGDVLPRFFGGFRPGA